MTAQHHYWLGRVPFEPLYVVSGLYPVQAADGIAPALLVGGGTLTEMPRPLDGLAPALALGSGSLLTTLTGTADLGAIGSSLTIQAGTLVSGLQGTTYGAEALSPGMSILGGTLALGLISTTIAPEAIAPGLAITSGTLA